jgi:glycosyltransferase involved in cell wall biosynthesis
MLQLSREIEVFDDAPAVAEEEIKRLSIIVPAYNEEKTIERLLNKIILVRLMHDIEKEIIIINDCSTDATESVVLSYMSQHQEILIKYVPQPVNGGKGSAIHTGILEATGEYLLIQDADLEYDPFEYNTLLKPIVHGFADAVYGSRFMGGNPHRILFFWHTIGNRMLTFLCNMFSNLNLTDMETGYKVFRRSIFREIVLKERRFGFEPEVTLKIARVPGIRIYEVGISYYGRTFQEGKKINWKDGIRTLYCILKYGIAAHPFFSRSKTKEKSDALGSKSAINSSNLITQHHDQINHR